MQCCTIVVRIVFDRRNFPWAELRASSCLAGGCPSPAAGCCRRGMGPVQLALGNSRLLSSRNSARDFSGQSCPSQASLSPQLLFSFPNCRGLCFITIIQPVLQPASPLFRLSTHFTATGTAPHEKKNYFTSPQFYRDSLPRTEHHQPPVFLPTSLSDTATVAADPGFAVAMEDAIWSL